MSDFPCIFPEFNFDPMTGLSIREKLIPSNSPPIPGRSSDDRHQHRTAIVIRKYDSPPPYDLAGLTPPGELGAGFQTSFQHLFGERTDSMHIRNTLPDTHGRSAITPARRGANGFSYHGRRGRQPAAQTQRARSLLLPRIARATLTDHMIGLPGPCFEHFSVQNHLFPTDWFSYGAADGP